MNVNSSTSVYSHVQNTSGNASKASGSRPAPHSSDTSAQPASSGQTTISGWGLMMSRLFGNASSPPETQTQLTLSNDTMDASCFLTKSDLSALSKLYAQAQDQGTDLRYVDDIARDLGGYRKFGSIAANYNDGKTYDSSGRVKTVSFTDKDAATASRILNGGNLSGSGLDPAFLRYELDPGFSFSHNASFDYLESLVNKTGSDAAVEDQNQSSPFATYASQGLNNYVLTTASEATYKIEETDFICKDGVFSVTETGKKHGFRLEGNDVVQDKDTGIAAGLSGTRSARTLMDYFLNTSSQEATASGKSAGLFSFLFPSGSDR